MAIEKQRIILISGIFLAILAIGMTKVYLDQQRQAVIERAKAEIASIQANQTAVLVAKQDIPQGAAITAEMFETSIIPNKFVQPQAVTTLDRISGMVTIAPITKGEQVSLSKLVNEGRPGGGDLAGVTPSGKRAISIFADSIASLSGMVKPGDYVDLLSIIQIPMQGQDGKLTNQTVVVPLFQNVLVLAVGKNTGGAANPTGRYSEAASSPSSGDALITLALGPQESNLLAFVQEQGKMRLVLRSPADAKIESLSLANWDSLFQYIMPAKPEAAPVVDTNEYVEVLRGLSKEKVPLSK